MSDAHAAIVRELAAGMAQPPSGDRLTQLTAMRQALDGRGEAADIDAVVTPVDAAGVGGEWVTPANAEIGRRLLYLHGGGYVMGSTRSHRPITARLANVAHAAVLAIDYRLMPEVSRQAGIDDVHLANRWILENGPEGESTATSLIVAGDSSGGNLVLSTIAWAGDQGLTAASAVVALCPHTDATYSSHSLERNITNDVLQGGTLGPLVQGPRPLALWMSFLTNRMNPRDPSVSPLLGDLSGLPPTLLQASAAGMFMDDAVRYTNKANAQGSIVELQVWPHTVHVWRAFATPETDAAFEDIARVLEKHGARRR